MKSLQNGCKQTFQNNAWYYKSGSDIRIIYGINDKVTRIQYSYLKNRCKSLVSYFKAILRDWWGIANTQLWQSISFELIMMYEQGCYLTVHAFIQRKATSALQRLEAKWKCLIYRNHFLVLVVLVIEIIKYSRRKEMPRQMSYTMTYLG